jgi:hypothetical protein
MVDRFGYLATYRLLGHELRFHRREQWDLECEPWLCVHLASPGEFSTRIFCVWWLGVQVGSAVFAASPKKLVTLR